MRMGSDRPVSLVRLGELSEATRWGPESLRDFGTPCGIDSRLLPMVKTGSLDTSLVFPRRFPIGYYTESIRFRRDLTAIASLEILGLFLLALILSRFKVENSI